MFFLRNRRFAALRTTDSRRSDEARHRLPRRFRIEPLEPRLPLAANQFAIIGDYGADGPNEAAVATMLKAWDPAFLITLGDNNYDVGAASTIDRNIGQYFQEFIGNYQGAYGPGSPTNRFFPSLGNHDWATPGAEPYLDYFTLPGNERYYDFVEGPVHFFALDSDPNEPDGRTSSSAQAQWLEAGLAASTSPFQVVYFHHAPYSSSQHGSDPVMQWPFKDWGADVVLAGHDHSYERLNVGGLPYFVNGLGGRSLYSFGAPVAGSQFRYSANYGAMLATYDNSSITFEFHSITGGDTLIDRYVLTDTPQVEETVLPPGAAWSYLDDGSNQGTAWRAASVDDSGWASGPAQLGYGDGDEATVVSFGPNAANKYITTYLRREFAVSDPTRYTSLTLNLMRDDGAIVYLNGQEVVRSNMPGGTITSSTLASVAIGGAEENNFYSFSIDPALLQANNVLAVELHQANGTSTDVSFDLSLVGTLAATNLPALSIDDVTVNEGNSGTSSATFTVSLSAISGEPVTASIGTANGTAVAPGDYTPQNSILTFQPGATSQTFTVDVVSDTTGEANETFFVNLSNAAGATIADGQGLGTIVDDDPAPTLAIGDMSIVEGNSGWQLAFFTVSLSSSSGQAVSVNFSTANGTANSGKDYGTVNLGSVSFAPGETVKTIAIQVKGDKSFEADETFFVNLSGASGATIADSQGRGTIVNDDQRRGSAATARRRRAVDAVIVQIDEEQGGLSINI